MLNCAISKPKNSKQKFRNQLGNDISLQIHQQEDNVIVTLQELSTLNNIKTPLISALSLFVLTGLLFGKEVAVLCWMLILISLLYTFKRIVCSETVTTVPSLGYQITTRYTLGQKSQFIPCNKVQSIFINEVILRHRVFHVLMMLTKERQTNNDKLVPLFLDMAPPLTCLEVIIKYIKEKSR